MCVCVFVIVSLCMCMCVSMSVSLSTIGAFNSENLGIKDVNDIQLVMNYISLIDHVCLFGLFMNSLNERKPSSVLQFQPCKGSMQSYACVCACACLCVHACVYMVRVYSLMAVGLL